MPGPGDQARCRLCATPADPWVCRHCEGGRLRRVVLGDRRTAEELGRAFPGVPLVTSGRDAVVAAVPGRPALVVSTPGAEPIADGGYGAAVLLDGWALLGRPDLRAGEEALRRWMAAAALVRSAAEGGRVVVGADPGHRSVQALIRWDPRLAAERELAERAELRFPPVARVAVVEGDGATVADVLSALALPRDAEVLGPVSVPAPRATSPTPGSEALPADHARAVVRVPRTQGTALADAVRTVLAARSLRKASDDVRIRIDPVVL